MPKKTVLICLTLALILFGAAGCMRNGGLMNSPSASPNTTNATPMPSLSPDSSPTLEPGETPSGESGTTDYTSSDQSSASTRYDSGESGDSGDTAGDEGTGMGDAVENARDMADEMIGFDFEALRSEVEKLSEVDSAVVLASGGRAIVGVRFDSQYQGTLTSRIEEMIHERITAKESAIREVAVTADPTIYSEIEQMQEKTSGDSMLPENRQKFDQLFESIRPANGGTSGN